jgi:hypothetical protein
MSDAYELTEDEMAEFEQEVAEERRRELAVEHLLFQTLSFVESKHPGLLDHLEGSLANLGDSADDDTKDDEAVREIARLFIASLRAGG